MMRIERTWGLAFLIIVLAAPGTVSRGADRTHGSAGGQISPDASPSSRPAAKVCRLGAVNVPYDDLQMFIDLGYDLFAGVQRGKGPDATAEAIHARLIRLGIEHFKSSLGEVRISAMGADRVPPERRGLKRGPGDNKYTNPDSVCGGWDPAYSFAGKKLAEKFTEGREGNGGGPSSLSSLSSRSSVKRTPGGWLEGGVILEDYLNRALCYCKACEADYARETGQSGFPQAVYHTPHYEDTVAFDRVLLDWDQKRTARHLRLMAEPIHKAGKKVAVAGVCRWIIGPEAADAVDDVMFYTYYAGRRLPPNFMRNWKYWHDHIIPNKLWLIFGYFREYHTCHTRLMLANLPDGVNLLFWGCQRQGADPSCREDAVYAHDVAVSRLVPIRVAVYDSKTTDAARGDSAAEWRDRHVDKAVLGFERLGIDATPVASLDNLDTFDLLYLEDVECLSQNEIDRIREAKIPLLITGLTGLNNEKGQAWGKVRPDLPRARSSDKVLNLPAPLALNDRHLNVENEVLCLEYPWFDFIFDTVSPRRGDSSFYRPYTDPSFYHGVRKQRISLIPSRRYGEFVNDAVISRCAGQPIASSSETRQPMIAYDADARQVYSTVKFSDYVNVNDLTECGYGYEMRQFCFLQIIDALTLERRGVRVTPYLMTAVRQTDMGHFLTIGNVYDEPRTVTVTLNRRLKAVRVNHQSYDKWNGSTVFLPPIEAKDAVQVSVDYEE
jgi:hypothetical protein